MEPGRETRSVGGRAVGAHVLFMYHSDQILPDRTDRTAHQIKGFGPNENRPIPAGGRAVAGSKPVSPISKSPANAMVGSGRECRSKAERASKGHLPGCAHEPSVLVGYLPAGMMARVVTSDLAPQSAPGQRRQRREDGCLAFGTGRAIETAGSRRLSLSTSLCSVRITRRWPGSRSRPPFSFGSAADRSGSAIRRPPSATLQ